jgi:hypothetical protein
MVVVVTNVLVGTDVGLHILGEGVGSPVVLREHEITALVRDISTNWVILDGHQVWAGDASGEWAPLANGSDDVRLRCLAPTPDGLLLGTSEARLFRLEGDWLLPVASFDEIESRAKWYTPWGGPPDSRSLAVDDDGTAYVNVHVGGILRSTDGGRSWEPTIDIDADVHQVFSAPGRSGGVLAATALGLATSKDAGDSWTYHTDGLHGRYCRAVAVGGETLFVSASEGHRGRRAALYRRALNATGPFEKCERGLPEFFGSNVDSHCLAANDEVTVFGTEDGDVYRSADGGSAWEPLATALPPVRCVALG